MGLPFVDTPELWLTDCASDCGEVGKESGPECAEGQVSRSWGPPQSSALPHESWLTEVRRIKVYQKVISDREILLQNQTALYAQAYQCGIPPDSAELRDNPSIRLVQHNLAVNSLYLQQIEARLVTNETTFLQQVQALKVEMMSMDPECLAVNAALAAWPTGEIPKIVGSAKREGAQEQSGEGSALLSKTNNHNTTQMSAWNLLDRPRSARDVPRSRQNPTLKWAGPKGQTRSGKNQV